MYRQKYKMALFKEIAKFKNMPKFYKIAKINKGILKYC